jgi:hypothetical protein
LPSLIQSGQLLVGCGEMEASRRYSGRPGGMDLDDFDDWMEAAYAKAVLKKASVTRVDFCRQMAGFLEHEALHLWRQKKTELLAVPEGVAAKEHDPIAAAVKLFRRSSRWRLRHWWMSFLT